MTSQFARFAAASLMVLLAACSNGDDGPPQATSPPTASPTGSVVPSPRAEAWTRLADAPVSRQEVAVAIVGGKVYVVGGLAQAGGDRAATLPNVDVYDPATNTWASGPRLPVGLHHAMAAEKDGLLHVIGGFSGNEGQASDRVFVLEGETWSEGPKLRRPRAAGAAVTVAGKIYVVGGLDDDHIGPIEILDGETWRDAAPIPTLRDHLGVATDGTSLFAAGGRAGGRNLGALEIYDIGSGRWRAGPAMPTPRSGIGAAFVNGKVVTVGGEIPAIFAETEAYDVVGRRWSALPDLAVPVHGVGVVVVGSSVYALLGGEQAGLDPTNVAQVLAVP